MGGRIYSLDQTHSECEWNLVEIMTQIVLLSPKSSEDQKKIFKPQFGNIFGRNWWDLFVLTGGTFASDHPALKSQFGDAKSRWEDPKSGWDDNDSRWENTTPYSLNLCITFKFQCVALKCYYNR